MLGWSDVKSSRGSCRHGLRLVSRGLILAIVLFFATTVDAQAYVDPNAAGLLFQILTPILAVVAAGWAALRLWSARWLGVIRTGLGGFSADRANKKVLTGGSLLLRLWRSLLTIAVSFSVVDCILFILSASAGWLTFLRPGEAMLSVAWHFAISMAEGSVLGTLATFLALPVLAIRSDARRDRAVQFIIAAALVLCLL